MIPTHHPCVLRWAIDIERWHPSDEEFASVLSLLPRPERDAATRYKHFIDRKRATVSRVLVRAAILRALSHSNARRGEEAIKMEDLDVRRTRGAKPFYAGVVDAGVDAPNFNFNVSHEGNYVVLASETHACVGVDVAAPGAVRIGNGARERDVEALLRTFGATLTEREIEAIRVKTALEGERIGEDYFRRHWSLKEAMVKAIGVGLAMDLRRCEFAIDESTSTARVKIDGRERDDWGFYMQAFPPIAKGDEVRGDTHWITVSRGPIGDIVDANGEFLRASFTQREFNADEWRRVLSAPSPPFELLTVGDLIPSEHRDAFEDAGGVLY